MSPSTLRRRGVFCRLARALAQLPGLLGERLHLPLDEVGLQLQYVLHVLGSHQLLGEFERAGNILLCKRGLETDLTLVRKAWRCRRAWLETLGLQMLTTAGVLA
jgi:hypothetical protein